MRDPRLTGTRPVLVLAAHGSTDERFAEVVDAVADAVRALRPDVAVRVGYLDHGRPLEDVVDAGCVVVPLLLASGYHVRSDIPARVGGAAVAAAVGPDPLLADALAERLAEAGYDGAGAVVLAAAGSGDERAQDEVRAMAGHLAHRLGVDVTAAFVAGGSPRLTDVQPRVVAAYLLAPGAFHEAMRATHPDVLSDAIGAHPVVADLVLARYDAAQVPGRTAPA